MRNFTLFIFCLFIVSSCAIFNKSSTANLKNDEPIRFYNLDLPMDSLINLDVQPNKKFEFSLKKIETDIDSNLVIFIGATIEGIDFQDSSTFNANPSIFIEDSIVYSFPDTIENSSIQVAMKMEFIEKLFSRMDSLDFKEFKLKKGESFQFNGYSITLKDLNKDPKYKSKKGDISVSAKLDISSLSNPYLITSAEPIYYIRDMVQYSVAENIDDIELAIKFTKINPEKEVFTFKVARYKNVDSYPIEVQIMEN